MYLLVSECATNHSSNPLLGAKPSVHIRWRLTREKKGITFIGKVSWQIDFLTWSQDNGQDIAGWLCLSLNSPFSLSFTDQRRRVIKNSEVDPCAKTRGAKAPTPSLSLCLHLSLSVPHMFIYQVCHWWLWSTSPCILSQAQSPTEKAEAHLSLCGELLSEASAWA